MAPRRVLMLAACPYPTAGGTQALIRQVAAALASSGVEVHLLTYAFGQGDAAAFDRGEPYTIHRAPGVPGHRALRAGPSWGRPAADALLAGAALRLARRLRVDLLHAHNYEAALAAALVAPLARVPWVYHAHNLMAEELETYCAPKSRLRPPARLFGRLLDHTIPRRAPLALAINPWTAQALTRCGVQRVRVLPPAIDPPPRDPSPQPLPPADVLYTGNLDGYQGIPLLMRAWQRVAARRPSTRFALVTPEPPGRAQAAHQAAGRAARTHLVPEADLRAVAPWLRHAAVAALPRQVPSGFPIKLLNYLHAGLPTVACASGAQGLTDADGVRPVPDADPDAFADALITLLDDPAQRRDLACAAAHAAARFSPQAATQALLDAYDDLLTHPGSP